MANIDFSKAVSSRPQPDVANDTRAALIRQSCHVGITAVVDQITQINLHGAHLAGQLSHEEQMTFGALQNWQQKMLSECRQAIRSGDEPNWPDAPEAVKALAKRF